MNQEMIAELKRLAAKEIWSDDEDFNVYEMSGGNFDDAYYAGNESGKTKLARQVLNSMGIEW